ncbi:R3H domain-containing protein 1 [Nowakowskiella sp. JEL0407]|nr:R3H domain-containing protein 1 [Nowakowskiella sp. JEL0407]
MSSFNKPTSGEVSSNPSSNVFSSVTSQPASSPAPKIDNKIEYSSVNDKSDIEKSKYDGNISENGNPYNKSISSLEKSGETLSETSDVQFSKHTKHNDTHSSNFNSMDESSNNSNAELDGVDPFLINTLRNSKDRHFLIQTENQMEQFVLDVNGSVPRLEYPNMNSYQRLIIHRVAQYYKLAHVVEAVRKAVIIYRTPEAQLPQKALRDIPYQESLESRGSTPPPTSSQQQPSVKIMQRRTKPQRQASHPPPTQSNVPFKSIEEKEAAYQLARAQIFQDETNSEGSKESLDSQRTGNSSKQRNQNPPPYSSRPRYPPVFSGAYPPVAGIPYNYPRPTGMPMYPPNFPYPYPYPMMPYFAPSDPNSAFDNSPEQTRHTSTDGTEESAVPLPAPGYYPYVGMPDARFPNGIYPPPPNFPYHPMMPYGSVVGMPGYDSQHLPNPPSIHTQSANTSGRHEQTMEGVDHKQQNSQNNNRSWNGETFSHQNVKTLLTQNLEHEKITESLKTLDIGGNNKSF